MKQDFTFGGIIFNKYRGRWKVLIVKRFQFVSWDMPKGHKEGNETDKEAALREVAEETGYFLSFCGKIKKWNFGKRLF